MPMGVSTMNTFANRRRLGPYRQLGRATSEQRLFYFGKKKKKKEEKGKGKGIAGLANG